MGKYWDQVKIRSCFEIKYSCLFSSPRKPPAIGNLSDVFCDHIFQCTPVLSFKRTLSPVKKPYIDSCIPGGRHIGPDGEGGDVPDKEVSERAGRLEDHAGGRQPQPQDQRHHPRASHGSHQVKAKIGHKLGHGYKKYKKL